MYIHTHKYVYIHMYAYIYAYAYGYVYIYMCLTQKWASQRLVIESMSSHSTHARLTSEATGHENRWDTNKYISKQVQEKAFLFDRVVCSS